jgi:putative hydrolase of the HAD superfamily
MALPKAILFDLDDTIISAYSQQGRAWIAVSEEFAEALKPLTPDEFAAAVVAAAQAFWADPALHKTRRLDMVSSRREVVRLGVRELEAAGRPGLSEDLIVRIADRFTVFREERMHLFDGAESTLKALRRAGVKLALVTNGAAEFQRAKIDRFRLKPFFDHIQIEGEHGFGKPEEAAYRHALAALGVEPHEAWMVGDNLEWEVAAPQRLGIFAIWHDHAAEGLPPDTDIVPDRIITSLPELLDGA